MKNIGQYNEDLSVPRKKDIDSLETRVKTNEDNIAMAESDIEGLNTGVSTLKTDVTSVKTALNSKQDTIVGAASTIVENNLTADKVLVSDASGKVGVSDVTSISTISIYTATIAGETTKIAENVYVFNGSGSFDYTFSSNLNNIIGANFSSAGDRASSITSPQITSLSGNVITIRFFTTTIYNPDGLFPLSVYTYT